MRKFGQDLWMLKTGIDGVYVADGENSLHGTEMGAAVCYLYALD